MLGESNTKITPIPDEKGENICYTINFDGGGFVILSADKRIIPILGYSKTGSFDVTKDMSSSAVYWLSTVKEAVKDARKVSDKPLDAWNIKYIKEILKKNFEINQIDEVTKGRVKTEPPGEDPGCQYSNTSVAPLISTKWGQGVGYNNQAPYMSCSDPNNGRAWTGCVATAMAQIMRKKQKPSGWSWSSMADTTASYDIALLMKDIGDNVGMNWGCAKSGAGDDDARDAFVSDYGYT